MAKASVLLRILVIVVITFFISGPSINGSSICPQNELFTEKIGGE